MLDLNKIYQGDCLEILKTLPKESVDCIVTSPPYWALRDYGVPGQLGLETTIAEYIENMAMVFDEVKRVLKVLGTCWVNMGDTYHHSKKWSKAKGKKRSGGITFQDIGHRKQDQGIPEKSLCMIPQRLAIEMIDRGWILRNNIIWQKPNIRPQSAKDRFTVDFDNVFFFTKAQKYYFERQFEPTTGNTNSGRVDGQEGPKYRKDSFNNNRSSFRKKCKDPVIKRIKRCIWKIPTDQSSHSHCATYPERLIKVPIKAGCPGHGIVLDPFMGSGTTAVVAKKLGRSFVGIELNPEYIEISKQRLLQEVLF